MPKVFTSKSQKTGEIGEHLAVRYLESKGFHTIERNYTKKWGEIDIVCIKNEVLHFVEVKSKIVHDLTEKRNDDYRPEENMHFYKLKRLSNTIQTYLVEKDIKGDWQVDLAIVLLLSDMKSAKVEVFENIM